MATRSAVNHTARQFLKTTTLHGFKYLASPFYIDRAGWAAWSAAGACCAGVLCAVVWARFLQTPALLALAAETEAARAPRVAVCLAPTRAAQRAALHLSLSTEVTLLPALFHNLLSAKHIPTNQLLYLNNLLKTSNLTLAEVLMRTTPQCGEIVKKCRWKNREFPCDKLFYKELTQWGACCIAQADQLNSKSGTKLSLDDPDLTLLLDCSDGVIPNSCEFYTEYQGEEWIAPLPLATGYAYIAQVVYSVVQDSTGEKLFDTNCVSEPSYARSHCLIQCKELKCGCSDPLREKRANEKVLPLCSVSRLNCLRSFKLIEESCACHSSCKKIVTDTTLEMSYINQIENSIDPMYAGINVTSSSMLTIRVRSTGSQVFGLMYTETWWSLLSTLGGVFNMSFGVGLFSTLEVLLFLLFKLPVAVRRSAEIHQLHHPTTRWN